jgi:hypothetical protein
MTTAVAAIDRTRDIQRGMVALKVEAMVASRLRIVRFLALLRDTGRLPRGGIADAEVKRLAAKHPRLWRAADAAPTTQAQVR